jgi:hypothetical protein
MLKLKNAAALEAASSLEQGVAKAMQGVISKRIPFFAMSSVADGFFFTLTGYAQGYFAYKVTGEGAETYGSWPAFMKHLHEQGLSGLAHSVATGAAFRAHGGFGGHFEQGALIANLRVMRESSKLFVFRSVGNLANRIPGGGNISASLLGRAEALSTRREQIGADLRADLEQDPDVDQNQIGDVVEDGLTYIFDTDHRRWGVPGELLKRVRLPPEPDWDRELSQGAGPKVHDIGPAPQVKPEDVDTMF